MSATIANAALVYASRPRQSISSLIFLAVRCALERSARTLADIDTVVSCAIDSTDGGIAPLLRSAIAGALSRSYLHLEGSSGHAINAALSLLEAEQSRALLLVGWYEGTRQSAIQSMPLRADPFYRRPVGLTPLAAAAMQTNWLLAHRHITLAAARKFADTMRQRQASDPQRVRRVRLRNIADYPDPALLPDRADGACAAVLLAPGVSTHALPIIGATQFGPYFPTTDDFDPAAWVRDVSSNLKADGLSPHETALQMAAPNAVCELRARSALPDLDGGAWTRPGVHGSLFAAHLGPLSGLAGLARLCSQLTHASGNYRTGLMVELDGPLGQSVSAFVAGRHVGDAR